MLPTAQLAYNTTVIETTRVVPSFANYRFEANLCQGPDVDVSRVAVKADKMHTLHETLKQELEYVRGRMAAYYNKKRLEGPRLERGDMIYLISRNLRMKRPSKKLDFKKIRPFKIQDKIQTTIDSKFPT